jgi:hypothetical protein
MANLAVTYSQQGREDKAEPLLKRVMEISKEKLVFMRLASTIIVKLQLIVKVGHYKDRRRGCMNGLAEMRKRGAES